MKVTHPNCLDLDPRDGDIELLEALTREFGFQPTQQKVGHWLTLGDIHDTLATEYAARREGACPSQRVFNRLREALQSDLIPRADLRPTCRLGVLADRGPREFLRRLEKQTCLDMPWSPYATMGNVGSILFLIGFLGGIVLLGVGLAMAGSGLLLGVLALLLMLRDKGRWPAGMVTLGDLADRVAALNHSKLGVVRDLPDALWRRLTAIAAEQSLISPQDMRVDTLLFAPRKSLMERLARR